MHQQNVSHMLLPLSVWESLDVSMETAQSQLNTKDCQESYLAILLFFFYISVKKVHYPVVATLLVAFNCTPVVYDLVFVSSACH